MDNSEKYEKPYKEMLIYSDKLMIPRSTYQRKLHLERVKRIVNSFDERIANEPKVSERDGRYYVIDGQHTIIARQERNGGKPLPILCKVYMGMTESEEAMVFAEQNGDSVALTPGVEIRARIYAGDPIATAFLKATESLGLRVDFDQKNGMKRIACVGTAFNGYQRVGEKKYKEALSLLLEAWKGDPDSLRAETITAMCHFVELYDGEYKQKRLIQRFRKYDPITIYREGRSMSLYLTGYKKYLYAVWALYNGSSVKSALPMKF